MLQYPQVSYLHLRETGQSLPDPTLSIPTSLNKRIVSFDLNPFTNGILKPTSKIIWIQGRENLTVTLNSHGQVVVYNMLDRSKTFMLTTQNENAFKVFFARDSLFLAVKENSSEFVQFFLIPLHYLQSASKERIQIIENLRVRRSAVKEIDACNFCVVVESDSAVEVWDFLQGKTVFVMAKNQMVRYQVTEGLVVLWEKGKNETKVEVFKFDFSFRTKFTVMTTEEVYFCKVVNSELIIGFVGCNLQVIELNSLSSKILQKGIPKQCFELENMNKLLMMFADGSCVVNTDNEHAFNLFSSRDYLACELGEAVVICGNNGKIAMVSDRVEIIDTKVTGIQQIGTNPDTSQILLACKGKVLVVE